MALILKPNKSFEDRFGNIHTGAYLVIDQVNTHKRRKSCLIVVEIYRSKEDLLAGKVPVEQRNYTVFGEDYDGNMSCDKILDNEFKTAYLYLLDLLEILKDDEGNDYSGDPVFNDSDLADNLENVPLFYDNQETSGSGTTTTYNPNQSSQTLTVANLTAGTRVRQTKMSFNYQSGKSLLVFMSFKSR